MYKSLDSMLDANFEVVREFINTGKSASMNEDHKRMFEICVFVFGLMRQFPQKNVCVRKIMAAKNLPLTTARRYVDFTRETWGNYLDYKREFLEVFFLEKLMAEISSTHTSDQARAKNLATLQKYLDKQPDSNINPSVMESNTINIQVNIGQKSFPLNQKMLAALPLNVRQQILAAIDDSVDDNGAVAMLES